jgi:hypothetical protein
MTQPLYSRIDRASEQVTSLARDAETGRLLILARQKTDAIVDFNKRLAGMFDRHATRGRGRMVANIPNVVYWRLHRLGITRDRKAMLRWLSRRDARFFRVDDGRPLA